MPDPYGLDKDARLAAGRKAAAAKQKKRVQLNPPFPYVIRPPDLDFLPFGAAPVGTAAD